MTRCGRQSGFTLIELLVTVALIVIIATVAVPSFSGLVNDNRLTTVTNNLNATLRLARSEAIKRNRTLTLCGLNGCGSDWSTGWQLVTKKTDGTVESVVQQHAVRDDGVTITSNASVTFNSFGRPDGASSYCLTISADGQSQVLKVAPSGSIAAGSTCPP
ncbi:MULTISPECIES: GspH/FimT family pseudopilin [Halomonadaceae]|uniref:GspH/FimT family pseudopilin n=1 Tax=Halomonadaceae TaxID=28256 RepID=UPI0020C6559A|nr:MULTISPECIES: GspH/FimT family pseudopilin [Halomonas]